ncbi:DUF6292 family protein [Actinophytocola oryzae]|uniref:DUF6292 family protein n=1 Tax=Actinophytocola oryzae TaxID=502181 RepID=UPI001AAF7E23|nr:DUF6292 family protein [Actinophytocola oryzae]
MTIGDRGDGLRTSFGDKVLLDGIDLGVREGTTFPLLGPNGAGKTTVVRILFTLIGFDGGDARVAGDDVASEADAVRLRNCEVSRQGPAVWWPCPRVVVPRMGDQPKGTVVMQPDNSHREARALRHYVEEVAHAVGVEPAAAWCEYGPPSAAYVALSHPAPADARRFLMLEWTSTDGWSLAIEPASDEPPVVLAAWPEELRPRPEELARRVRRALIPQVRLPIRTNGITSLAGNDLTGLSQCG